MKTYTEILKENKELKKLVQGPELHVKLLANVTIHQLKELIEYELLKQSITPIVEIGNYDNIVQDAMQVSKDTDVVIVFWELANLTEGFEYRSATISNEKYESLLEEVKAQIELTLSSLKEVSLVIFNKFTSLHFSANLLEENKFDKAAEILNAYLDTLDYNNVRYVDVNKVLYITGQDSSLDLRNYYSSKSLYSINYYRNYVNQIKHYLLPLTGKIKKALILDCDNTLWRGIIGEDGIEGIKMSGLTSKGRPYAAVQHMAHRLASEGILIALSSKNNEDDVQEVLENHPDMILQEDLITMKMINWNDKASNIRKIAETLNIGLDSFIFIDDSAFEIGLINEQLPEVTTFRVPSKTHLYPLEFAEIVNSFYRLSKSAEDLKKVEMYKQQAKRVKAESDFASMSDYLNSLQIEIEIFRNEASLISRLAQMTQKTNQFNLTTRRYTETDVFGFIESNNYNVYAISVRDKYGESGVTGLAILEYLDDGSVNIDSFLMSCRIIGRGIEDAFISHIMNDIKESAIVKAQYIETKKNKQVEQFYDKFGFSAKEVENGIKNYQLNIKEYTPVNASHIKIFNGRKA